MLFYCKKACPNYVRYIMCGSPTGRLAYGKRHNLFICLFVYLFSCFNLGVYYAVSMIGRDSTDTVFQNFQIVSFIYLFSLQSFTFNMQTKMQQTQRK